MLYTYFLCNLHNRKKKGWLEVTNNSLRILLPFDLLTVENLNKIKQTIGVHSEFTICSKMIIVKFPNKRSLNDINILAIKLSSELNVELFSIFQNQYECTITYTYYWLLKMEHALFHLFYIYKMLSSLGCINTKHYVHIEKLLFLFILI